MSFQTVIFVFQKVISQLARRWAANQSTPQVRSRLTEFRVGVVHLFPPGAQLGREPAHTTDGISSHRVPIELGVVHPPPSGRVVGRRTSPHHRREGGWRGGGPGSPFSRHIHISTFRVQEALRNQNQNRGRSYDQTIRSNPLCLSHVPTILWSFHALRQT